MGRATESENDILMKGRRSMKNSLNACFFINNSLCKEDIHSINISFGMAWRIIMFHS